MSAEPMTDEELAEIEARANAAPREHEVSHFDELHPRTIVVCGRECPSNDYTVATIDGPAAYAVAELYGHAQEDELALVDEVVRLRAEVEQLRAENARLAPRQRAGQRIFNAVYALDPAFANDVRGSSVDPFHDDERCEKFLAAWLSRAVLERTQEVTASAARMVERGGVPPVLVIAPPRFSRPNEGEVSVPLAGNLPAAPPDRVGDYPMGPGWGVLRSGAGEGE
jgi:hypothetical protein